MPKVEYRKIEIDDYSKCYVFSFKRENQHVLRNSPTTIAGWGVAGSTGWNCILTSEGDRGWGKFTLS